MGASTKTNLDMLKEQLKDLGAEDFLKVIFETLLKPGRACKKKAIDWLNEDYKESEDYMGRLRELISLRLQVNGKYQATYSTDTEGETFVLPDLDIKELRLAKKTPTGEITI